MCGISGIVYKDPGRRVEDRLIQAMTDALSHRGPDDQGIFIDGNVGLGHRRLSVVDLSSSGHQPMSDPAEKIWITYNGEVYNHLEIREGLEAKGYAYRTRTDTESVLYSWQDAGIEGVQAFRGMFAYGVYERDAKRLSLVRDRIGIKPLYYVDTPKFFAFASEIKALLLIDEFSVDLDRAALLQILALKYTCDDSTLFSGVKKLLPGHYLVLENGSPRISQYYDFERSAGEPPANGEAVEQFREIFDRSVKRRLMADVPLGMFLSGGIDSSVIASRMAGMRSDRISTFSVAFAEREANELEYARLAAESIHADHHEVTLSTGDFFGLLPRMIYHEDEPLAHPSSVALYAVSRLAREHVIVVLTGEGSDELLGGYERYHQTLINLRASRMLSPILTNRVKKSLVRPLIDALPYRFPYRDKAVRTSLYLDGDLETIFLDNYSTFSRSQLQPLLAGRGWTGLDPCDVYAGYFAHMNRAQHPTLLSRMLYADMKTYLLELLMKQDQMSMAASVESRVPFLDHEMVEFVFRLPDDLKIRGLQTKRILRQAFKDDIPPAILQRPKMGFPVPIRRWFAEDYHEQVRKRVLDPDGLCAQLFDRKEIEQYCRLHREKKVNHADRLWLLLNLEIWNDLFMKRVPVEDVRWEPKEPK